MIDVAIRQALLADDDVVELVGNRITPGTSTKVVSGELPRIVYSQTSEDRRYCDDGYAGLTNATYQFDIFAERVETARAVQQALVAALDGLRDTINGTTIERIYFTRSRFMPGELSGGQNQSLARIAVEAAVEFRDA